MEGSKRILLIDDKLDTPLYITLREEGHEVIACDSPQKAWNFVYPFRPHFIVIRLPHPSRRDIAILQECRAMAKGVPIIVATSEPGHEAVMKVLEDRATSFLSLPAKGQAVRKLLEELEPLAKENDFRL